jgi:cytochrome c oxidase subunit 2
VIHSFWVPRLHGKIDLIPSHENTICCAPTSRASTAASARSSAASSTPTWRCSSCGAAAQFERLAPRAAAPRPAPTRPREHGQAVVHLAALRRCATPIRGTPAGGRTAPDLTHLARAATLAAGTLPNTPGHLAGWILDPPEREARQRMPPPGRGRGSARLLDYLGACK